MEPAQGNLFRQAEHSSPPAIAGLNYIRDYITPEQEAELVRQIDLQPWLTDLKRRVQHYGYRYDYKARGITPDMKLGELPEWLLACAKELNRKGYFPKVPEQVIINEYQPGQGIAPHVDVTSFAETIASLSLGSPCIMEFTHSRRGSKIPMLLEPRSLIVLSGEARHHWKHSIPARKTDKYAGITLQRSRRISLTFRNLAG
jgi:alkylated DNA repair dioxygenase AlkB